MMLEMMFKNEDDLRFAIQPTGGGLEQSGLGFRADYQELRGVKTVPF